MRINDLGYDASWEELRKKQNLDTFRMGRVVSEHKERYVVKTSENELDAEIIGNLRYTAHDRSDFPAVGDWVAISEYDENKALIHAVLPRKTILERQAVGKQGERQIIATNIDCALIIQSVDRDFSLNRIERYLTLCNHSQVKPLVVLNKTDLVDEQKLPLLVEQITGRIHPVPVIPLSSISHNGYQELNKWILKGKTYCLLGSSGVGKSTIINNLYGKPLMKTLSISESSNRGRHATSHRELVILKNGGILIDNPGMREVGVTHSSQDITAAFHTIAMLAEHCKFKNCTHTNEVGCAVIKALENDELNREAYENYLRLERERQHFELNAVQKHKKEKAFGKILKNYHKTNIKGKSKN